MTDNRDPSTIFRYWLVSAIILVLAGTGCGGNGRGAMDSVTPEQAVEDGIIHVPGELGTIQSGLNAARSGDTVLVAGGIYFENLIWPEVDGISLASENGAGGTTIDGRNLSSVITIHPSDLRIISSSTSIEGFTITHGHLQFPNDTSDFSGGGGISVRYSSPTIAHNIIRDNRSEFHGGGIRLVHDSDAVLDGNIITDNLAVGDGGGVFCRNLSNATFTVNEIRFNISGYCGGGVYTSPTSDPIVFSGNNLFSNSDDARCESAFCDDTCIYNQVPWNVKSLFLR